MRNRFADTFFRLGKRDPRLCIVVADISPAGSISAFRQEFPERFINTGVAEQAMIGICAGMCLRGLRPFAYTIATFSLYRPFEFVRDDLCYQNLPVTVVGIGGGVTYSTLGGTHHAQEDIGIARSLPNLSVLCPCDPDEVELATQWCAAQTTGPVYLRLGKAGEPVLTAGAEPWRFGALRYLSRGSDLCILSYGTVMAVAAEVAARCRARGESVSLVSVHTIKPLDQAGIIEALNRHRRLVVIEEAGPTGSLGERVKALAWESGATCKLAAFGLKDQFVHCYGSHADLLAAHGLSAERITAQLPH